MLRNRTIINILYITARCGGGGEKGGRFVCLKNANTKEGIETYPAISTSALFIAIVLRGVCLKGHQQSMEGPNPPSRRRANNINSAEERRTNPA